MSERIVAQVNPAVLKWARTEAGYTIQDVSKSDRIPEEDLANWESDGKDIPFSKLESLGRRYRRQLAVFFLPAIPEKKQAKPKDYRNRKVLKAFTPAVLLSIRRAARYQRYSLALLGEHHWQSQYDWLQDIAIHHDLSNANDIATKIRELLGVSHEEQLSWKDPSEALRKWRQAVEEKLGIMVFQFAMPEKELDGFCLASRQPYCVVLNRTQAPNRKIFTLFHEVCHLLYRESGVCIPSQTEEQLATERFCNDFAGRLLLPEEIIERSTELADVLKCARRVKVSAEAYLLRLYQLNALKQEQLDRLLDGVRGITVPKKKMRVAPDPVRRALSSRGQLFYNTITEAVAANKVAYTTASDLLGLNLMYLVR